MVRICLKSEGLLGDLYSMTFLFGLFTSGLFCGAVKKSRKKVDQVVEPLPKGFHFWLHVVLLPHEDLDELLGHRPQVSDLRPPLFDLAAESSLLRLPRLEKLGLGRVDPLRHFLERVPEFFQQRSVL